MFNHSSSSRVDQLLKKTRMDFDDDYDDYKRPSVLPVANFDHYDPQKPPTSGEEYLRRVQLEAQKCPEVAIANLDVESFRGQQTEVIPNVGLILLHVQMFISLSSLG